MIKAERLVGAVSLCFVCGFLSWHAERPSSAGECAQTVHRHQGSQFVMGAGEAWVGNH